MSDLMHTPKKEISQEKPRLHPRNKNRERYDLNQLQTACPALSEFVKKNIHGDETIDFANPDAVKALNQAILKHHYGIDYWDIPAGYLCPPIPGRADYIHHIADLLSRSNYGKIPVGANFRCLDVGVGANCIYPIIGVVEYGWSFIGSDIDDVALESAKAIVAANPDLSGQVECRLQPNRKDQFYGVITRGEFVDLTICNPPFHASAEDAQAGTLRKLSNLNLKKENTPVLNFGGQNTELWCEGGEGRFVGNMIRQSKKFGDTCFWFSSLISKQSTLSSVYKALDAAGAVEVVTLPMGQGNKSSRVVAWTFLTKEAQIEWKKLRWKL